jgi:transposase
VLKKASQRSTGKTRSAERTAVPEKVAQERRARHRQRVSIHKRIWKLYRQGCHKEQIAQLVGVSSRRVYRALEQETPPPTLRRSRSASIVDPYLSAPFCEMEPGVPQRRPAVRGNCRGIGYTGTQRTLQMRLRPFRQKVARPVSKQTVIWDKPPSPRGVALMMVRPAQSRTREQAAYLDQLIQSNETIAVVFKLAQDFGRLLRKREGQVRLEQWKATVRASRIAELIAFVDGLADDAEAVANGCSLSLLQRDGRGVRKSSQMDQTELLWTSGISFASTPSPAASLFQRGTLPRNKARRLKAHAACENREDRYAKAYHH